LSRLISPSSTDKNVEIVRSDIMTEIQTPVPSLSVCEFTMVLPSLQSKKKKKTTLSHLSNIRDQNVYNLKD